MQQHQDIWAEIRSINDRLERAETFDEKIMLRQRKSDLADRARTLMKDALSIAELQAEVATRERQLEAIFNGRVDPVQQAGSGDATAGSGFGFAADAQAINRAMDSARGRVEVEVRISELRRLIEERTAETADKDID